jgi:hypothetical protein
MTAPHEQLLADLEAASAFQFDPMSITEVDEMISEAAENSLTIIAATRQSLSDAGGDLEVNLELLSTSFETRIDDWIGDATDVRERVDNEINDALALLEKNILNADKVLQDMILGDLSKQIAVVADGANAFLAQIEAAIEQAGGALFSGVGEITEPVEAVKDVLQAIKPITAAFEALS